MTLTPDSPEKHSILVVDDEPQIRRVLKTVLGRQKYSIRTAADGEEALAVMKEWPPDLVITDLRMPNMDGIELCRSVRKRSAVPIIILSVRGEEAIKIEALDQGADDYVTKPFSPNELLARVRAALRRSPSQRIEPSAHIEIGDFVIDTDGHLVLVRGQEIRLTPKEFDLLTFLARNPGKILTHRVLLTSVWGATSAEQPEYLRVFVNHLRKKLEPEDGSRSYIVTEPWIGYRFEPGD